MNFYAFKPRQDGSEPVGTQDRMIARDLMTLRTAFNRAEAMFGSDFRMYTFTNFYDNKTFRLVSNPSGKPIVGEL